MTTADTLRTWRTPLIVILFGCVVSMVSFGPRSALGQFLTPISLQNGWTRETFSLALALQNLFWGLGQPFAGAVADRFGTVRVLIGGLILYGLGLALMAYADTPGLLQLSAGGLIGFGLSGASGNMVIGAFGKLVPESKRSMAFGACTAAGSFGQFLFSPLARGLIDGFGWQSALLIFAAVMVLTIPFCFALATPTNESSQSAQPTQSFRAALGEAFAHPSYVFLVLGFFTCGFQLAFTTVHLPAYLVDRGLGNDAGAWTIAVIGLFNIFGSLTAGYLGNVMPKRYILAAIYFSRAVAIAAFILLPATLTSALIFGAVSGFLWLSTVPPTSALVAVMFGTRWLAMLYGFAFFSHQVGGFLGVWLGGVLFDRTGSYDVVWWLSVALGIASGLINLPIRETAVLRPVPAT
ncbi:putative MFS-type transporter YhjX [Variibacter gotjawalensis]|uniref:Putative MFS-type transporter YhjX n=1 Tax=Variibacter gotjawalensis TaxID=1333996 RepID=A0A0S3PQT8_9BRAD|nr:MFS transporter [Variibacter gotjawalensis]NIK48577.1 MFS family permease [Variibacter gotjawalensis]RZS50442.1 putative MFS family arabinose efflux permease [Variibacter gotjawalensis]BAT58276.1 putative MFS-type transporter YhjX [Variibacter gotjawalensis]